jgi:hypothetical protein
MEAGATWDLRVADHWIREYLDLKTRKYPKAEEKRGFMICSLTRYQSDEIHM